MVSGGLTISVRLVECSKDSVTVQKWILLRLSGEVECLKEDLQAEQEQVT